MAFLDKLKEIFAKFKFRKGDKKKRLSYEELEQINKKLRAELEATKKLLKERKIFERIKDDYDSLRRVPVFVFNLRSVYKSIRKSEDPRSVFLIADALSKRQLKKNEALFSNEYKRYLTYAVLGLLLVSVLSIVAIAGIKAFTSYNVPTKVVKEYVVVNESGDILGVYSDLKNTPYEKKLEEYNNKENAKQNANKSNSLIYVPPVLKGE